MKRRLLRELAADGFDVAVAGRVLEVSRSGCYEWVKQPPSKRDLEDAHLANTIVAIHADSRCSNDVPRVHAELRLGMASRLAAKALRG